MSLKDCRDMDLNKPFPSDRKNKKFQVCVKNEFDEIENIHFGDDRYEDFTQHRDLERLKSFRARHNCDPVSDLDKATPKYWSCQFLWNRRKG